MADYFPPSENLPIFDVSVFRSTNDNVITQDEADRLYLSRLGTASSLATSTSFQGPISTTGNLTLNGAVASNRQIEGSFLKLVDNASISTNKPYIWYPDPELEITTNDVTGPAKAIVLKTYDGNGVGTYSQFTSQYNRVTAQGNIRLTRLNDAARYSTFSMGATELTIANNHTGASPHINLNTPTAGSGNIITNSPVQLTNKADTSKISTLTQGAADLTISNTTDNGSILLNTTTSGTGEVIMNCPLELQARTDATKMSTITQGLSNLTVSNTVSAGNILLNTTNGAIVANTPFVPADIPPALFSSRPSIGYAYSGSVGPTAITGGTPTSISIPQTFPLGVYLFEASVTVTKSTSTFSASGTSSSRMSYLDTIGSITYVGLKLGFENLFADNTVSGLTPCGVEGGSRVMNVTTSTTVSVQYQAANWATIAGSPTFMIYWSAVRIA